MYLFILDIPLEFEELISAMRTPNVSEALAEGMTVVDYAPNSTAAEDYGNLAGWVKSVAAPASTGYRGVRWSEK